LGDQICDRFRLRDLHRLTPLRFDDLRSGALTHRTLRIGRNHPVVVATKYQFG
jgi:hypothetical protein